MNRPRNTFSKLLPHICLSLLGIAVLEIVVRLLCHTDPDGGYHFRLARLKPYQMPVTHLEKEFARYENSAESGPFYDPELGWALRPGVYNHNAAGFITSGTVPNRERSPGTLRIGLLGNSYVQSDFHTGWWRVLEDKMNSASVKTEVLNFGVSAYGTDQAYLRWHRDCAPWKPDVVICGFFADDCSRNLNLLRLLRDPDSGVPFMKPRFLTDGEGLKLVNSPTPKPLEITPILQKFPEWPLSRYEHYYKAPDYRMTWWRHSRLLALLEAKWSQSQERETARQFYEPGSEASQITLRILRQMRTEADANGAVFYVIILPSLMDLEALSKGEKPLPDELNEMIRKEFKVISVEKPLTEAAKGLNLEDCFPNSHYNEPLNAAVGKKVAERLMEDRHH
ncbi:MAG: hypothetical protein WCH43_08040 [Verrucomicrobiota bacterium]